MSGDRTHVTRSQKWDDTFYHIFADAHKSNINKKSPLTEGELCLPVKESFGGLFFDDTGEAGGICEKPVGGKSCDPATQGIILLAWIKDISS